jgi:3-oxoadipate enol-lactonase
MTVRLHHQVAGAPDRPTVVIGGSVGSTIAAWERQIAALAAELHVIAYDHRGHGGSPAPAGPYAIDDLAGDVLRLLDDHDVSRAHFVGLSLGGMVGQLIAAQHPGRAERLVLLCTTAHYADRQSWHDRAATVRAGGMEAVADPVVDRWLTADYRHEHPEETDRVRQMLVSIDPEGYAGCCEAIAAMDLRAGLAQIQAPTLVLAGAQDPAVPPQQLRELAAAIPGSRFVIVPGAHVPTFEHPDTISRLLLEHLVSPGQRLGNSE